MERQDNQVHQPFAEVNISIGKAHAKNNLYPSPVEG